MSHGDPPTDDGHEIWTSDWARAAGAARYWMGVVWRSPKDRDIPRLPAMPEGVKAPGIETCVTLGMRDSHQSRQPAKTGLNAFNHDIDTSRAHYGHVITARSFADRLDTLADLPES